MKRQTNTDGGLVSSRFRNGLEQISLARTGRAECVPVMAQIGGHTLTLTGVDVHKLMADPSLFIGSHLLVSEYYELDVPSLYYDLYNIEAEALGQELVWLPGMFPEINTAKPLLAEPSDLARLHPPDPTKDGRMPFLREVYRRITDLGLSSSIRFCAPFSLAANIRGLPNFLMDIMMRQEFAHELLRFLVDEVLAVWIESVREACGEDLPALGADALASLPMTNLDIIEQFALSYVFRLRDQIGRVAVQGLWGERFIKDSPEKLMELKLMGYPGLVRGLDPDAHELGPDVFVRFSQEKDAALMLGLDCGLLANGLETDVVERVRRYVEIGKETGRLLFYLNEVSNSCPSANVHAAVQTVRHFGRYERVTDGSMENFQPTRRESFDEWVQQ